ncbi:MAG: phage tail protein [Burkholderiaceae bacterium]|nr:phage tail protein [Burkholderiaceae bacterium]
MTTLIGRGVRVEIGKTEGSPKVVTAVTQAKPGVGTSVAHGLAAKSVGYFKDVTGMVQLDGQAARLSAVAADSLTLENINTTNFPAFTGGSFVPITAWSTLNRAASYSIGGGAADQLDDTVLFDDIKQLVNGLLASQTVTFNVKSETVNGEAAALIEDAARNLAYLVFRVTLKDGSVRVFRGQPSLAGEDVQNGQIGTGSFTVTVKGFVNQGAA